MVELTSELFNLFANNILTYKEKAELVGEHKDYILEALEHLPASAETFHIEISGNDYFLWRKKAWLVAIERRKQIEKDRAAYNAAVELRKDAFRDICLGLCDLLGLEPEMAKSEMVRKVAEKALAKKSDKVKTLLNIDIEAVPDIPKPHIILDEKGQPLYKI